MSINNALFIILYVICLCDADYVAYRAPHLFQSAAGHKNSAIGKHFHDALIRSYMVAHERRRKKCFRMVKFFKVRVFIFIFFQNIICYFEFFYEKIYKIKNT